eukprot:1142410-Pelagomonas_calceolata.AAC.2
MILYDLWAAARPLIAQCAGQAAGPELHALLASKYKHLQLGIHITDMSPKQGSALRFFPTKQLLGKMLASVNVMDWKDKQEHTSWRPQGSPWAWGMWAKPMA